MEAARALLECFVKDHLYLVEESGYEEEAGGKRVNPLCGGRIFVLSLLGGAHAHLERLQI